MISFKNDYSEIGHPNIIQLLQHYSQTQFNGYGLDDLTLKVQTKLKQVLKADVDIHLMGGGTITNKVFISHILKPYEAVISADTGHIFVHETGAIESTGHQIILVPNESGKLTPASIDRVYQTYTDEHRVIPKLVYISNATETGTFYTLEELKALYDYCQTNNLYLFIDGARLGVALAASNLSLETICLYSDAFYIGGTKNGAMLGEALVIKHPDLKPFFRYSIKQSGGLLAKGFVTAIQFEALFTNDLFFRLGQHANELAQMLTQKLSSLGITPVYPVMTNQVFITLPKTIVQALSNQYAFEIWTEFETTQTIRLVTSWFTQPSMVDQLIADLKALL